jgi:hypothetical protein
MRADNSRFIVEAAQRRREEALRRTQEAIAGLDRAGEPISFRQVALAASVSRAWLHRQPHIAAEIDRLRTAQANSARPLMPSAQRGSHESHQQRIAALLEQVRSLKRENDQLRDQVARLLGERRQGRLTHSASPIR